ncbi:site-specific integrase [Azospirillum doebereinerae]
MTISAYFSRAGNRRRLYDGPLGVCIDAYAARLVGEGYRRSTAWRSLRLVGDFSRWLERHRLGAGDVDERVAATFLAERAGCRRPQTSDRSTLNKLLVVLREAGVAAPPKPAEVNTRERIFNDFAGYLARERGLVPRTIIRHWPPVRLFLQEAGVEVIGDFARLDQAAIIGFVERHARDHSPAAAKGLCWALRAFLRYLRRQGWTSIDLAGSVPTVRRWRQTSLPTYLSPEQIQQVLTGCDRETPTGRRDFAILMLLARLGLRANEVTTLTLDAIDWQFGQVLIDGKGRQRVAMPLPADVGAAIASYLRDGRPRSDSRRVFLRQDAPHVGFATAASVFVVANAALTRAGIQGFAHMGAHLFRHSLATALLRSGASLTEIGQVLRHRDPDTTRLYAKVDIDTLRRLGAAWPGGRP